MVGENDAGSPEAAITMLLRRYAEKSSGRFPSRLDDWIGIGERLQGTEIAGATDPELVRLVNLVVRVRVFLLDRTGNYSYKVEGVKLGQADKIILWYKPKGSDKHRAIFADLDVADVTADQFPKAENPRR